MVQKNEILLPKKGEVVQGTILNRGVRQIFVDLGPQGTGIIFGREFLSAKDILRNLKVGDQIVAKVVEPENEEGYVELSIKEAGEELNWQKLRELKEKGEILSLKVESANRGGLILSVQGISGFMPASQLSKKNYPQIEGGDKNKILEALQKLQGKELQVKILDLDPGQKKLIFSEKLIEEEAIKEKLGQFHIGDIIEGTVSGIVDFGIFVRFGEGETLEGLVHISELDWQLVKDPRDLFKLGQKVKAKILDIQDGRVSLSIKALKEDPWQKAAKNIAKGSIIEGKVLKYTPFGAFIEISPIIQGLIHISEFGKEDKMKEALPLGETKRFRVVAIDPKEHRLSLKPIREQVSEEASEQVSEEASEQLNEGATDFQRG